MRVAALAFLSISTLWAGTAALPAPASAKPGFEVENRSLALELSLPASHGFQLAVTTEGHRKVTLTATKHGFSASYTTRGRVSRNRIEAEFGRLGRVALRFRGSPRPFPLIPGLDIPLPPDFPRPQRDCRGRKPQREVGRFTGTIRFEGETGFTRVAARRARGEVRRHYRRVCKRGRRGLGALLSSSKSGGGYTNLLIAVDRSPHRVVSFEAANFEFTGPLKGLGSLLGTIAVTSIAETREGMRILRGTAGAGDDGALLIGRREVVTATVALPRPFRGTADYRKEKGSPPSWIGSLRSWVPGAGTVRVTDPDFSPSLCRISFAELLRPRGNRCLRRSGASLPGPFVVGSAIRARISAQISGSQSQDLGEARLSWSR